MGNHVFYSRGGVTFNEAGDNHATQSQFRVEGGGDAYLLVTDPVNCRVGIGDSAPGHKLDVAGDVNTTGVFRVGDVQVVGTQQAHIANATGTLEDVVAKMNALLTALETHGLLASA